jgi:hypothetical protein
MSAASDEPLDDGPNSTVPAESKRPEPDVTLGDTQVTPDPGATVDSARKSADAAAKSEAASSDEDSALVGATVIPGGDVSGGNVSVTVMSDWESDASLEKRTRSTQPRARLRLDLRATIDSDLTM